MKGAHTGALQQVRVASAAAVCAILVWYDKDYNDKQYFKPDYESKKWSLVVWTRYLSILGTDS